MDFSLTNLLVSGFHKTTLPFDTIPPIELVTLDQETDGLRHPTTIPLDFERAYWRLVNEVVSLLEESYSSVQIVPVSKLTGSALPIPVWAGVDPNSLQWHNDSLEGGTLFALLYFDDDLAAGVLQIKSANGIETLHPQRGDLVFVSNNVSFQHRASLPRGRMTRVALRCNLSD